MSVFISLFIHFYLVYVCEWEGDKERVSEKIVVELSILCMLLKVSPLTDRWDILARGTGGEFWLVSVHIGPELVEKIAFISKFRIQWAFVCPPINKFTFLRMSWGLYAVKSLELTNRWDILRNWGWVLIGCQLIYKLLSMFRFFWCSL